MAMILEGLTTCGGESRKFFSFESRVYIRRQFCEGFLFNSYRCKHAKNSLLSFFCTLPRRALFVDFRSWLLSCTAEIISP